MKRCRIVLKNIYSDKCYAMSKWYTEKEEDFEHLKALHTKFNDLKTLSFDLENGDMIAVPKAILDKSIIYLEFK